jgi:HK97 family phage prohead protease
MTTLNAAARARAVETGKEVRFREVSFIPRSFDKATRSMEFVCSTDIQDRHGTIVKQTWRLDWFKKNPIGLFAHDSRSPIGRWDDVRVEKGQLIARHYFAERDELADRIMNLCEQGIVKAVSVGFIAHSYKYEKHNDVEVLVFDDNELLEVSIVSIPANPEALARDLPIAPPAATAPAQVAPAPATPAPAAAPEARQAPEAGAEAIRLAAAAETRAAAAEQRAARLETERDAATARAQALETDLTETRQKLVAAETAAAAAKAAEAVEKARADKHHRDLVTRKVDDLVGVKIDPVDRAYWLGKALKDETDFDETMRRTKALPTEVGVQIVKSKDPAPPAGALDADQAAARLEELARERSKSTGQEYHHAYAAVQREHPELCA